MPKKNAVGMSMKPADGVIMTNPEMAPMKVASIDHLPVSKKAMHAQVSAPVEAHRFVTQSAMTDWKERVKVVPASNASQEPQIMIKARSWKKELPGRWSRICVGVRTADLRERKRG